MRYSRRLSRRLVRCISLGISVALLLSLLTITPIRFGNISTVLAQDNSPSGQGSRVAAPAGVLGPPEANLPNLDELRLRPHTSPQAQLPLPSMDRSRRNPLEPPNGKKVGDPGTTLLGALNTGHPGNLATSKSRATVSMVKDGSRRLSKFSHTLKSTTSNPKLTVSPPPPIGDVQYVQNFFQYSLGRQPYTSNPNELGYWDDILRVAYANGNGSIVIAARELGKTLFESSDYAARNRSNHDYVYDLYETYLLRGPDTAGWAYWESMVPSQGREAVRRAFDESGEFVYDVGTITPNGSASSAVSSLLPARVDLTNQTGNQLLARDCEWAVSLLSLPGRSGLDLGLSLAYSSAVWTRSGPYLYFDEDNGWPSPGFRLGFPTVQEKYFDAQVGVNIYLLITPSGHRVELRQVDATNYHAADSSYLQLTDNGSTLLVRDTSGAQLSYSKYQHEEWHCTQIKDRNGNYISVNYDWMGHITSVTDTVNRTINFNYDGNANLISITQTWNGQTPPHPWATFGWGSSLIMQSSSFSGVAVAGTYNGESIPVIRQVSFDDGTYAKFLYNGQGQVTRITNYASDSDPNLDNHARSYTAYDYDNSTSDCPRINDARVWAENWNGINGVPAEVTNQYVTAADYSTGKMTAPDGTIYKEFYATTGWQKRLTTDTKIYLSSSAESTNSWEKDTVPTWTQDDTNANYQINPRVTETIIYDSSGNRRRTKLGYTAPFNLPEGGTAVLPSDVYEYQYVSNVWSVLRRTHTDYNLGSQYLSITRRIIGLPSAKLECDGAAGEVPCTINSGTSLVSRVELQYDESAIQNQGATVQYDDTNYGATFLSGRGNLTSTRRYDVSNMSNSTVSSVEYNTVGGPVTVTDPLTHHSSISYTDSFSVDGTTVANPSNATFAYPTTVTDADGYSSYMRYNYDFGAKTRTEDPKGAAQTFTYDSAQRIIRTTTANNGAYKRFYYAPTYVESWWSVNNVADEGYANQHFDGLGRVIAAANIHPGSVGGYSGQVTVYDQMGRAVMQSNPTEIAANWVPSGDDGAPATNVALAANGGVASASSYLGSDYPSYVNDGSRRAVNGAIWLDNTIYSFSDDSIEVDFNGSKTISEIDVVTQQDDYQNPVEPTLGQTMSLYGITAFDVQYWNGLTWVTVQNGNVTGNNKVWRQFTFASVPTSKIRVVVHDSADHVYSRVVELEAWTPGVHDGGGGWYYTYQSYDWKGRPLVTTNTDGTQKSASYSACGCVGSEVTTLTDEGTLVNGELKHRTQKIYSDPLGRTAKTEVLNWDGSIYSTAANTYNARDQVTLLRQYAGSDQNTTYQDTTASYDGYGRLSTRHAPEQNAGTATVYNYNADDTVNSVTDARGASATYTYNNRHLVSAINYSAPSGITATPNVSFGYDAVGNRTSMTDGLGSATYSYNELSRMTSETRTYNGVGSYTLSYNYNLAGELKTVVDPWGATVLTVSMRPVD